MEIGKTQTGAFSWHGREFQTLNECSVGDFVYWRVKDGDRREMFQFDPGQCGVTHFVNAGQNVADFLPVRRFLLRDVCVDGLGLFHLPAWVRIR